MHSPLAYIHPEAQLGENVVVHPFSYIDKDTVIGDNTVIGPNATIYAGSRIGKNGRIFPGAVIGAIPQDLKFEGEYTLAILGDNVTVRENVTVNRGTKASGKTVVGNNVLLMANAHVAHDCIVKDHAIIVNNVALAGHVEVGEWTIIGGLAAVQQFVKIGPHVMVSGGSLVRKDIPPFVRVAKEPLQYVGVNSIGLRRRGFTDEKIREIQDIYRILYLSGMNIGQALEYIEKEMPVSKERDMIIDFIRNSTKGIVRGKFITEEKNNKI
ncbi:MAG: acyl-ACP--UDP-N-acetylglucosamine O-acyltransferase [Chlorobi bacterium]|nr:acyl-ACP--UDP-N-acetylglucosamine O-acyltransferase [Chlorobiota bacterium]